MKKVKIEFEPTEAEIPVKVLTHAEVSSRGGKNSVKSRFKGLTKEQISKLMSKVAKSN